MQPAGGNHQDGVYTVHFQVWRPSPTSCGGSGNANCYSLVGENRFPGVTLEAGRLVSETPQPTNVITVRPGDVLGYFVSSTTDGNNDGIQLDPDFTNDVVYYADLDAPLTMGTASVGSGGVLACPPVLLLLSVLASVSYDELLSTVVNVCIVLI